MLGLRRAGQISTQAPQLMQGLWPSMGGTVPASTTKTPVDPLVMLRSRRSMLSPRSGPPRTRVSPLLSVMWANSSSSPSMLPSLTI